jgi:hypothetical protein
MKMGSRFAPWQPWSFSLLCWASDFDLENYVIEFPSRGFFLAQEVIQN